VDDPYGPRLISFSPSYSSNPYILAASLADVDRWPELALPSSPPPSDDEGGGDSSRGASGFPGATRLKYTTTIMGPSRMGTYGLRTDGARKATADVASVRNSLRFVGRQKGVLQSDDEDGDTINGPEANATPIIRSSNPIPADEVKRRDSNGVVKGEGDDSETEASHNQTQNQPQSQPKTLGYIPKFKGAAEMEARRRLRLMARAPHNPADVRAAIPAGTNLNPEDSSSEDIVTGEEEGDDPLQDDDDDDDGFDSVPVGDDTMDIGDEFDPFVSFSHSQDSASFFSYIL
jgi:target of rapamycin complex 2 subunit MAPKAP1